MTRTGRNEPCPCGSGRKFRKCCGPTETAGGPVAVDPFGPLNDSAWRLLEAGRFTAASAACDSVLNLAPGNLDALHLKAVAECQLGHLELARTLCQRAVQASPKHPNYLNTLGNILLTAREFEAAIETFRRALALNPGFPQAHFNLGLACWKAGRIEEALACNQEAARLDPGFAQAHYNLSLQLLQRGDYERGWVEYEWRWLSPGFPSPRRDFPQPQWTGGEIPGKTLLLHAEQGIGDTLQFIRYVPCLLARGATVIVDCQPELVSLFRHSLPGVAIVSRGSALPAFDCHCPLLSLPLAMATRLDNLPGMTPYLLAAEGATEQWRIRFQGSGLSVGLVWRGNPSYARDRQRSLDAAVLEPLMGIPGVHLVSLQKARTAADEAAPLLNQCEDAAPALSDFAATAAAIMALDLVISVDTAVAHLAAALGKPTWVLLPNPCDWRWGLEGAASPWYPTLRLFRQQEPGNWREVLASVAEALKLRVAEVRS